VARSAVHVPALDGLRGVAILLVMIYHFGLVHAEFHSHGAFHPVQLLQGGWLGVDLFFVLSGFLITGILLDSRTRPNYLRNFLARRTLRIWPLYYLTLVVFFVIAPAVLTPLPPELASMHEHQAWFWTYAANWLFAKESGFNGISGGYFWSLAVEEQFYLAWPFVVRAFAAESLARVAAWLFVGSVVLRVGLVVAGVPVSSAYCITFTHLDGLAAGALLACTLRSADAHWTRRLVAHLPGLALGGLAALALARAIDGDLFFWSHWTGTVGIAGATLAFAYVLWRVVSGAAPASVTAALTSAPLVATGKYSYALYLVHMPVSNILVRVFGRLGYAVDSGLGFWVFVAAAGLVSWAVSFASWHLFEKHVLSLKRYF
jgi:peptidoglycan/LPS O-acetylase OafA/YrhL